MAAQTDHVTISARSTGRGLRLAARDAGFTAAIKPSTSLEAWSGLLINYAMPNKILL